MLAATYSFEEPPTIGSCITDDACDDGGCVRSLAKIILVLVRPLKGY